MHMGSGLVIEIVKDGSRGGGRDMHGGEGDMYGDMYEDKGPRDPDGGMEETDGEYRQVAAEFLRAIEAKDKMALWDAVKAMVAMVQTDSEARY